MKFVGSLIFLFSLFREANNFTIVNQSFCRIIKVLFDDETLDKIADKIVALLDEDNKVIPLLEAQLGEVRKSIDNVMKAIEAGIITRSTKAKLEELEA